ncbi:MAG: acyl-CoA dehydrogenase family protein [Xanthobacteraceae bacterium]
MTGTGLNQSPPFVDIDLYSGDLPLQSAVAANGAQAEAPGLADFGRRCASAEMFDAARQANENLPRLRVYDARGFRLDTVEFHPAYHRFMAESMAAGLHASTWRGDGIAAPAPAQVARAARFYMAAQVETGHLCPITMTRAAVAALTVEPALAGKLLPKILSRQYDARFIPWTEKSAITLGMGMTERQGGTDVRTNTSRATAEHDHYLIAGQKWFMSAPMCDAFLVLAQAQGGLTCFLVPRFQPDGSVNALHFRRLKDKLGNRSNASSEVGFESAFAWRVGEEGRGIRTIINMVQLTRFDCAAASAGLMRMALAQAVHHTRHRTVFQKCLIDQPVMRAVLADMALVVEAAIALVMRLARSFDLASTQAHEAARARLLTPAVKYWVCKIAPALIYEAMECLGGNGYVEESVLPRLYREAPVNAIWEGSGNVMCLDVLRALASEREASMAVIDELGAETADLPAGREAAHDLRTALGQGEERARAAVGGLAALAAAAALRASAPAVAEFFGRTRLERKSEFMFGATALESDEASSLLGRALPQDVDR